MIRHLVADVGNSRVKLGLCDAVQLLEQASVPHGEESALARLADAWKLAAPERCTIAGVHPDQADALADWFTRRGHPVRRIRTYREVPIAVRVDAPEKVGVDRLLNAVAARSAVSADQPAICVDAGSAITIDLLNEAGAFVGGAILPGLQLMARSLNAYTARLPLADHSAEPPHLPAKNTLAAITAGIYHAAAGAIDRATSELKHRCAAAPRLFLTGGDANLLARHLKTDFHHWPGMTLEGLRQTADFAW